MSIAAHLLVALIAWLVPGPEPEQVIREIELVAVEDEPAKEPAVDPGEQGKSAQKAVATASAAKRSPQRVGARARRSARTSKRRVRSPRREPTRRRRKKREAAARRRPPDEKQQQRSCLLSMRGCGEPGAAQQPPRDQPADRLASFRPRHAPAVEQPRAPRVAARTEHRGLKIVRYEDGGRTLSASGQRSRPPGFGEIGLLRLANAPLGSRVGRTACDPYRDRPRERPRVLVLLVDTSGSIVAEHRAPRALVCAAGAALSALAHGHAVAVANFSSSVWYMRPSRDESAIYTVLSQLQREGTKLPPASLLRRGGEQPRDFVLVSDTAIENLASELPGYARVIRSDDENRALLYVLGGGDRASVERLTRAGFAADFVDQPGRTALRRAAARERKGAPETRRRASHSGHYALTGPRADEEPGAGKPSATPRESTR